MKRRSFMKTAVSGTTAGISGISTAHSAQSSYRFNLRRDFIRVGMVGLGPYSHAMMYTEPLNDPTIPPRTNMRVTAIWGRQDNYRNSYVGTEEEIEGKVKGLLGYMDRDKFRNVLGVEHVVRQPEDMLGKVDAVFITDPDDALNLARPFLEEGMPIFLNRPNAWNMHEIREIIRLAKENGSTLVTGSCVPWMQEIQVVSFRINDCLDTVQQYYIEGSGANFCSYFAHIVETALKLVPGRVERAWCFGPKIKPDVDPPGVTTMAHYEYAKPENGGNLILGTLTNGYEKPNRCWAKIIFKDKLWFGDSQYVIAEPRVYWEHQVGGRFHDEHISLPLMRIIDHAFLTGVWPETEEHILNKVATMLMTHKSLVEGGQPVTRADIENHSLPRKR